MMLKHRFKLTVYVLVLVFCSPILNAEAQQDIECEPRQIVGHPVLIEPGRCHRQRIDLAQGRFWIRLDEHGIDLVLIVNSLGVNKRVDVPVGRFSSENVLIELSVPQEIEILIETDDDIAVSKGTYSLAITPVSDDNERLISALKLVESGSDFYAQGQWQEAVSEFLSAASILEPTNHHVLAGFALQASSFTLMYPLRNEPGSYTRAVEILKKAEYHWTQGNYPERVLSARKDQSQLLVFTENYEAAGPALAEISSTTLEGPGPNFLKGVALNDQGYMNSVLGRANASHDFYLRAINVFEANGDLFEANNTRHNLANLYRTLGETELAINMLEEAESYWYEIEEPVRAAISQSVMFDLYFNSGNPDEALTNYDLAREVFASDPQYEYRLAVLELQFARAELALGRFDTAKQAASSAFQWATNVGNRRYFAQALMIIAEIVRESDDIEIAVELLEWARAELAVEHPSVQSLTIRAELADIYTRVGKRSQAKQFVAEILDVAIEYPSIRAKALLIRSQIQLFDDPLISINTAQIARDIYIEISDPFGQFNSHRHIASAYIAMEQWAEAVDELRKARDLLDSVSSNYSIPQFKTRFAGQHKEFLDQLVFALEKLSSVSGTDRSFDILYELENRRLKGLGSLQADMMGRSDRSQFNDEILEYNRALDEFGLALQDKLLSGAVGSEQSETETWEDLNSKLLRLEAARRSLPGQNFSKQDYLSPVLLRELLTDLLTPDRGILYFHVGKERSIALLIRDQSIGIYDLPAEKVLEDMVKSTLASFSNPGLPFHESVEELENLLAGIINGQGIKELIVVPDGPLNILPFGALSILAHSQDGSDLGAITWSGLPSILYAIRFLSDQTEMHKLGNGEVLLLGDPVTAADDSRLSSRSETTGMTRLPYSALEVDAIAKVLNSSSTKVLTGFAARKMEILEIEKFHDVVHIASHGTLNSRLPASSGVLLSSFDEKGEKISGHLGWADLNGTTLPLGMVFLSGCTTALGEVVSGDGVFGISRGFLDAGALAVIASYWRISDRSTVEFATEYYRQFVAGHNAPTALKKTMLEISSNRDTSHPYYWAGFGYHGIWNLEWENSHLGDTITTH